MKKLLCLLMPIIILFTLAPTQSADAATIKISKTKTTILVGESINLKITGTTKSVKWTTSNKKIITITQKGAVTANKAGTATITASVSGKKLTCKVTAKYDIDTMKNELYNWIVGDLWNDSFCDIYHYVEDGKNAVGGKMNLDKAIANADKAMKQFDRYEDFINSLNSKQYSDLKDSWGYIKDEINYLYNRIKEETPRSTDPTYEFEYQNFNEYMYDLMDELS